MTTPLYRGRFAPSPTGYLHFGSLLTAVGSFLHARHHQGEWLVRIEDLDIPRNVQGASAAILDTLIQLGMYWDGEVWYQSQRLTHYQTALACLNTRQLTYPCICPRRLTTGMIYSGYCRTHPPASFLAHAIRLKTNTDIIRINDEIQGEIRQNLADSVGDFVLKRRDGIFAYQLAVVVDDAAQGITHIVRGVDLLDNTPRQCYLQTLLQYPTPYYAHLPLIVDTTGRKLSKQNHAPPINPTHPIPLLYQVLKLLGQQPPLFLYNSTLPTFWEWAIAHWDTRKIPPTQTLNPMTV
ncbi:tRNA glutamyl-Q(34) synthetase GluQRS [Beggiatoa leptomitoformis]|uniref:Glutamyl-Q tRNA(Asp) synthetase n=1 Tax=Beggiatoa leptomitoformis TaxID=288004 RepID=A0A2N9YJB4_9GAMM|nr:tRNA glutamyl-Q(34) synthetase GluQRS [Beggiatoa leptomitoformis]ALG69470.1 tRNA glutamyl-Q(34) synthetase GluQRS [Beggiatoa leptomitoformis]AUI70621.1 tRNA glutamyl-Q(34) synthetase GluQRS [Beggiatoa leptomitoformis]